MARSVVGLSSHHLDTIASCAALKRPSSTSIRSDSCSYLRDCPNAPKPLWSYVVVPAILCIFCSLSLSQSITGLAPFAPLQGGGTEIVNLANLNVHLSIPVVHKSGRGLDFNYVLNYDSSIWTHTGVYGAWTPAPHWGWRGTTESTLGYITYTHSNSICPNQTAFSLAAYVDQVGTEHGLAPANLAFDGLCNPADNYYIPSGQYVTVDGSSYSLTASVSNNTLSVSNFQDRSGNLIVAPLIDITTTYPPQNTNGSGSITDPNGNQISTNISSFSDSLGMTVLQVSGTNPVVYKYTGPNQTTETVTVYYSTYNVATDFGCVWDTEYPPTQTSLISSIVLADTTSYTFQYEQLNGYYTGRISQLGLPTGGTIKYQYPGANDGINCVDTTTAALTRTLSDGSVWQYTQSGGETTITDPAQNTTVMTTNGGAAVQTKTYQGSSTLLQTVTTCYNPQAAPCTTPSGPASNKVPEAITTVVAPASGQSSQITAYYNTNSLPTEIDTYDFGSSSPTQKELITYANVGNGILDRPNCDQVLFGTTVPSSCGTVTSNTASLSTATYDSKGNLQSSSSWTSGVTTPQYLTKSFQYYSNGLLHIATDVNGNQTTFGYQNCNSAQAYPNSITSGGLSTSMTWDCNGGVITQVKDANLQPTNFGYLTQSGTADPFWRVRSVEDPLDNFTWTNYGISPPTKETVLEFNNNSSVSDVLLTLDGLGRIETSQVRTAPGSNTFDNTIQYGYGWTSTGSTTGPFVTQTIPGGSALTTAQLDALGRTENITDGGNGTLGMSYSQNDVLQTLGPAPVGENPKSRQAEYDILGRIKSVCEILSTGGTNCGQNTSASGYKTSYTYTAPSTGGAQVGMTQGVQTRTYVSDGIGRLISQNDPESGTSNAVYDSEASCGPYGSYASSGDLLKFTDARGVSTCNYYDVLHRLTDVGNSAQSTTSPCKRFRYDNTSGVLGSRPSGVTIGNTMGRLAEAETDTCASPITQASIITDEWFSYDADGNLTDVYELTPHSGGYYHTTAGYFPNGVLGSLAGLPGLSAYAYSVDGEGRPYSAVAGSTTFINGVTFNSASQPTIVQVGNKGDQDNFTYDPATGRMTKYNFTVNSKSESGVLGWNANGTLNNLSITDQFNAGGTQTCYFNPQSGSGMGYDDLGRLVNESCGSIWSQTFSYDQYGNITKSGTSSWIPGYISSTNQYVGASYDAAGNVLYDFTNTYTWDAYGKMASAHGGTGQATCGTNGTCMTYDAFGQPVEKNAAGTYAEILYSPYGKTAIMSGQTLTNAYVPMPGGQSSLYDNLGGHHIEHRDWRGSVVLRTSLGNRTNDYDRAFAAFGEMYDNFGNSGSLNFTGDTQDLFSGLFDTPNRELSPGQGRWLSPDPAGFAVVDFSNPQSWNRYAYIGNEPLAAVDPLGLVCDAIGFITDASCQGPTSGGAGGGGDAGSDSGTWTLGCTSTNWGSGESCSWYFDPTPPSFVQILEASISGGSGGAANSGKSAADIARCAAKTANSLSLAALLPQGSNQFLQNALSNDFSTVSDLITGPAGATRLNAAASVLQGRLTTTAVKAVGAIPVGPDVYKLGVNGAGTTFVEDVVTTPLAEKALGKTAGALLGTAIDIKLAYDLATYAYGVAKCW